MITKEDKDLLLRDLCARLPYGVFCNIGLDYPLPLQRLFVDKLDGILLDFYEDGKDYQVYLGEVKPYLRPMSSMTDEELHEVQEILGKGAEIREDFILSIDSSINSFSYLELIAVFEWFNAHHFDYRGLIEKGLAFKVTAENNPYK